MSDHFLLVSLGALSWPLYVRLIKMFWKCKTLYYRQCYFKIIFESLVQLPQSAWILILPFYAPITHHVSFEKFLHISFLSQKVSFPSGLSIITLSRITCSATIWCRFWCFILIIFSWILSRDAYDGHCWAYLKYKTAAQKSRTRQYGKHSWNHCCDPHKHWH